MNSRGAFLLLAVLAAAGAGVGLYVSRRPAPGPGLSSPVPAAAPAAPAGVPSLEESDPWVREKSFGLSNDLSIRSWLSSDSLASRLVAGLARIARGEIPRESLAAFAPRGAFALKKRGGKVYADLAAGGTRYKAALDAASSIDPAAAAKLFDELEPLLDAAQAALGERGGTARETFFAAARELLAAPAVPAEPELKPGKKGVVYVFADPKLEALSAAQKQLIRLGPAGQKAVQDKLRAIALAMGKPGSRLE